MTSTPYSSVSSLAIPGVTLSRGFDHLGNVDHDTVREYREGRPERHLLRSDQVIAAETLFCRSSSAFEIAVRLNEDPAVAEHVGKLCDLFAVLDRGFKWFRKVLGYQGGQSSCCLS